MAKREDDFVPDESLSVTEQVVLLGLVTLSRTGETPCQTHTLRRTCCEEIADNESVAGTFSEADVMRSLYRLENGDFVAEIEPEATTPTGKGRPSYRLAVPVDRIAKAIDDDLLETPTLEKNRH